MEKMKRSEFVTYLDTTPDATASTFALLGIGIIDFSIAYNPNIDSEKWIFEDNARHIHNNNEKQGSVSQSIYKDDPCYEFIYKGKENLNNKTKILDINRAKEVSEGKFEATLSDGLYAVTSFMGENATIEYDLYYEGDVVKGSVEFDETGKPTFIPEVSA